MKIALTLLAFTISTSFGCSSEKQAQSTIFVNEASVLKGLRKFNVIKRAAVTHDGVKYHIYTGGKGSGVRYFNAFVFRQSKLRYTLVYHVGYTPVKEDGFEPIWSLTPEFDKAGISFQGRIRRSKPNAPEQSEIARCNYIDLQKVSKEGIAYQAQPEAKQ